MNRFLKKEWDDTEIPQQVLWRTRNRAWQALQQRQRRRRRILPAMLGLASLAVLLLLWVSYPSPGSAPPSQLAQSPEAAGNPQDASPAQPQSPLLEEPPAFRQPQQTRQIEATRIPASASIADPDDPAAAAPQVRPGEAEQASLATTTDAQGPQLERVVMNFRLPRSGVRMIWIKQKTTASPSGGTG